MKRNSQAIIVKAAMPGIFGLFATVIAIIALFRGITDSGVWAAVTAFAGAGGGALVQGSDREDDEP